MDINNMTADPRNLKDIFKDGQYFKVPIFQRDYSWNEEKWIELWNDIEDGIKENRSHYLGSIVLVNNGGYKEIIDGQQRLTTLSVFIKSIHYIINCLIKENIDLQNNIKRAEMVSSFVMNTNNIFNPNDISNVLNLNKTNNDIYNLYILKDKHCNSEMCKSNRLLLECYEFFKKKLTKSCSNKFNEINKLDITKLLKYYEYIIGKLIVVEISVSDYANAYVIFETLNDRGLELTVTDLLKNYLFSKEDECNHEMILKIWDNIVSNVDEKNVTKYIRHYWNCKNKKTTEKDLFKTLKRYIDSNNIVIYEFLKEIEEASEVYSAIMDPNNQRWNNDDDLRKYLKEIKLFKVELCYPVLLAAELFLSDLKLKRKIFKLCSRISFRYITISRGAPGDLENAYNDLCLAIFKEKNNLKLKSYVEKMSKFIVPKDEFIAVFKNKEISTRNNKKLIKYILENIERSLSDNGELMTGYTIEHILPENCSDDWKKIFNDEHSKYRYRLGNYILLEDKDNSEIGNKSFEHKKKIYKDSNYFTAKKISEYDIWDIKSIEKNQKNMAKIAHSIWNYN